MTIRSRLSSIMELIGSELPEFAIFDFVYTVASANIDQSVPDLAKLYVHKVSDEFDYGSN